MPIEENPTPDSGTFLGVRNAVWFGIAKWLSIAGGSLAALITALAGAWKMFHSG